MLEGMNDRQYEAATHVDGPLLIIAGAGSGKTRVLTHRIAYLIEEHDVNPYNIMAITFTNKAAAEMRERIDQIIGMGSESIWVMTFHATCVRILRRYIDRLGYDNNFTIYDTEDSKSVMKAVFKKLQIDPKNLKETAVLHAISRAKDELLGPEEYALQNASDFGKSKFVQAYREYQDTLKNSNALDFDDIIRLTVLLFKTCPEVLENYQNRFRYIMVDEYQDTNTAQFELVRLLADKYRNLCVVGDDDQSIYKFRGANIMNILNFENIFRDAKVIKLEQNYRSTKTILKAANAVIANNKGRKCKKLWTDREDDERIRFQSFDNAQTEAYEIAREIEQLRREKEENIASCAILYRTNAQSREFEEIFVRKNIPYQLVGGVNFYSRKEIKDVLAYLKTICNGADDLATRRIINTPKRGIGAASVSKVQNYADEKHISFFEACVQAKEIPGLGKAALKIYDFSLMIRGYKTRLADLTIQDIVEKLLEDIGYIDELLINDEEDAKDRIENIHEFISKIAIYETEHPEGNLTQFLEEVALISDLDQMDKSVPRVTMMTIHSAKGLEFPRVYLTGLEEGIFPSYMTVNSENTDDMEEERRLAYVAITRAMDSLHISCAKARMVRGETQYNPPSRFVKEIPEECLTGEIPKLKRREDEIFHENSSPNRFMREQPYTRKSSDTFIPRKRTQTELNGFASYAAPTKGVTPSSEKELQSVGITKGVNVTANELSYGIGDRVKHIKFGVGTVENIVPGARDYQVTVCFDEAGRKIMYAAFAKLQKMPM